MSTTIPALDPVTDILDTDKIMVTQQSGQTYTMSGASFNKRNQAIIASSKTITGAPLKTGNVVRVLFTAELTAATASTALVINYNGVNYNVKICKNGSKANYTPYTISNAYKYCQAYTTLEFIYDGTDFIVLGNPVVLSSSDYIVYVDGTINKKKYNTDSTYVPTAFLDIVIASYDSVLSYKSFEGSTQSSIEGRWWGYKHSNYGIALIMTREYLFVIRLATTNGVTSVTRQRLLIDINSN